MDVVISKYNEKINWKQIYSCFSNDNIFVYDKSGQKNDFISLPNIGREAHTYLTHIVLNYDLLSEFVCFLQGNPLNHLNVNLDLISSIKSKLEFYPLNKIMDCNLDGGPHHPNLQIKQLIFDKFFIDKPDHLYFVCGAQFIVKKESIISRKKEFYIDLLKEFDRPDIDNKFTGGGGGAAGNKMPWVMERVWRYIFDSKFRTKYDK